MESCKEIMEKYFNYFKTEELQEFSRVKLSENVAKKHYRELIKLSYYILSWVF